MRYVENGEYPSHITLTTFTHFAENSTIVSVLAFVWLYYAYSYSVGPKKAMKKTTKNKLFSCETPMMPYLPSDPHLAGPTSINIVKRADQQDQSENQHFQPHTYYHINFVLIR